MTYRTLKRAERFALFVALWSVLAILSAWGVTELMQP